MEEFPAGRGGSLAGPAGAEEPIRNRPTFRQHSADAAAGQVRNPSISRGEVKAFLDGLRVTRTAAERLQLRASGAHEPAAGGPGRHEQALLVAIDALTKKVARSR